MEGRGCSKPGAGPGLGRESVGAGMKRECGGGRFSKWGLALRNTEGAVAVAVPGTSTSLYRAESGERGEKPWCGDVARESGVCRG